ncbi:hypothetical protein [Porphyromonas sp.]|uniref:hypothetical protein n=1 Tax=Porphyromonas sp. TaxID=1924944 RepID=UPI0026DAA96A|nr:hypothetical protein [Porphyromonas sp.]MDO4770826.1 hypothetical protein [Porphyromonas sp.]
MKKIILYTVASLLLLMGQLSAQCRTKGAWEFSIGSNALGLSRLKILDASKPDHHYLISADRKEVLFGVDMSIGREIGTHRAVVLSQSLSEASEWVALTNIGAQYRFGTYFRRYAPIDPYLTVGVGYMYNGFAKPLEKITIEGKDIDYEISNQSDKKYLVPIYAGGGLNTWLNDRWGLNLEGGYQGLQHMNVHGLWYLRAGVKMRIGGTQIPSDELLPL